MGGSPSVLYLFHVSDRLVLHLDRRKQVRYALLILTVRFSWRMANSLLRAHSVLDSFLLSSGIVFVDTSYTQRRHFLHQTIHQLE